MSLRILFKFSLLFFLLQLPFIIVAQESVGKYQSLLWKIERDDIPHTSYLYGTMHVSQRVAYRLSDNFFEALESADIVGLETNPLDWMDAYRKEDLENLSYYQPTLYKSFLTSPSEKQDVEYALRLDNQLVNGILYRSNSTNQNFEEDTYLDMFIFQAGSKYGKPVVALEDLEESRQLVKKSQTKVMNDRDEYPDWLSELLEEKRFHEIVEDAYREQNLDMIDSMYSHVYTENFNKYMLYIRNENIAESMDSLMATASVFSGIGAAHLPGEEGVIELLRAKGYTVSPLKGEMTDKGRNAKENYENRLAPVKFVSGSSADGTIEAMLPGPLYGFGIQNKSVEVSLDITNGGFVLITRISRLQDFNEEPINIDVAEELLFENIPGKIIKQEKTSFQGLPALSVQNKTKEGDYQQYLILETDLELIIVKLSGKKEYAKDNAPFFFDNFKIRKPSKEYVTFSPYYGDFKISIPDNYTVDGNSRLSMFTKGLSLQAYDKEAESYFFAKTITYHDFNEFEEDAFELSYIPELFYEEVLDTTMDYIRQYQEPYPSSISSATLKGSNKKIWLKTIIQGPRYYMLGVVGRDSTLAFRYFDSFEKIPFDYEEKYKTVQDTSLFFSVNTSIIPPRYRDYYSYNKEETDSIESYTKVLNYQNAFNEVVEVSLNKSHDYIQFENIDSIFAPYIKNIDKTYIILEKKRKKEPNGVHTLDVTITDTLTSRIIREKRILKHGAMYVINYNGAINSKPSPFVEEFFNTFEPKDTLIGRDALEDKAALFLERINSGDSLIVEEAFGVLDMITFKDEHTEQLIALIDTFDFKEEQQSIRTNLIESLGLINNKTALSYLKNLYATSEYNSHVQIAIIEALNRNFDKANAKTLLDFLEKDIPLSSTYEISNAFNPLYDTLSLAKVLYPEIMQYAAIPEYKRTIYNLVGSMLSKDVLKSKKFRKYKKQIINEMKIEFKRQRAKDFEGNNNSYNSYASDMYIYIRLLVPFYESDKEVRDLFKKLEDIDNDDLQIYLITQLTKNNLPYNKPKLLALAEDPKTRLALYQKLESSKLTELYPKEYKTQKHFAEAELLENTYGRNSLDSLDLYLEQNYKVDNKSYILYFFKSKYTQYDYNSRKDEDSYGIIAIAYKKDENKDEDLIRTSYLEMPFEELDFQEDKEKIEDYIKKFKKNVRLNGRNRINNDRYDYNYY